MLTRFSLIFFAVSAFAWQPPHLIPPAGVAMPEADQRQLRGGLTRLAARMDAMKTNPHIANVRIFHKAVQYALDGNEFFTPEEIFRGKELLRMGNERMTSLERGEAPWTRAVGPLPRRSSRASLRPKRGVERTAGRASPGATYLRALPRDGQISRALSLLSPAGRDGIRFPHPEVLQVLDSRPLLDEAAQLAAQYGGGWLVAETLAAGLTFGRTLWFGTEANVGRIVTSAAGSLGIQVHVLAA